MGLDKIFYPWVKSQIFRSGVQEKSFHDVVAHFLFYQVPPTPKDMGKEKEGRVEKEKPDKKKDKQKPPPADDEVGL